MKITKNKVLIFSAFFIVIAMVLCVFITSKDDLITLDLSELKNSNGQYQYKDIVWNSSTLDVTKALDFEIESAELESAVLNEEVVNFFQSVNSFELDGNVAKANLEFYDDEIEIIKFDFKLDENCQEWFDTQLSLLKEMNGEADETTNNANGIFKTTSYKWIYEDTSLQFILLEGTDVNPSATIGVMKG